MFILADSSDLLQNSRHSMSDWNPEKPPPWWDGLHDQSAAMDGHKFFKSDRP